MNNPQFERTFSDLAHTYIREKAPKLLDYIVGFQILDKNDDDTKAAGVFGFQVGKQWFYVPVFFLNGELKGHELLYIKDQDVFVPLQENWVNYLINRKPVELGESTAYQEGDLAYSTPNFHIYGRSPLQYSKSASLDGTEEELHGYYVKGAAFDIRPALRCFCILPTDEVFQKAAERMHLPRVLEELGEKAARAVILPLKENPDYAAAVMRHYDVHDLLITKQAVDETPDKPLDSVPGENEVSDKAMPVDEEGDDEGEKVPAVEVIRGEDEAVAGDLTDDERKSLIQDEVVIRDHRKGGSQAYRLDVGKSFTSAGESGLYELLIKPAKFVKALIIQSPLTIGEGEATCSTVVDIDSGIYVSAHKKTFITSKQFMGNEWKDFVEGLSGLDSMTPGKRYMIVTENITASIPFTFLEKETNEGVTKYWVNPCANLKRWGPWEPDSAIYPDAGRKDAEVGHIHPTIDLIDGGCSSDEPRCCSPISESERSRRPDWYHLKYSARPICSGDAVHEMVNIGDTLMVPSDAKVVPLEKNSGAPTFEPGTLMDVQMEIFKTANLKELKIFSDGDGFQFQYDGENEITSRLSKNAALERLVVKDGILVDQARAMLKEATEAGMETYLVKEAQPPDLLNQGPVAPGMGILDNQAAFDPMYGAPTEEPLDATIPLNMPYADEEIYNPDPRLDQNTMQAVQDAAQTGKKEVFDTSILGGLVKAMNTDDAIDKYLGDLILGEDRVGRLLFMFYWHNDRFSERYGEEEMQELEDALKNTFKSLGDLILFLKKKSIEPDMALLGSDVDLEEVS